MNEPSDLQSSELHESHRPNEVECGSNIGEDLPQLGAMDIVESFTALRHELKLQVRGGRELQQTLLDSLQRIEQRIALAQTATAVSTDDTGRDLAEALAEMDDSLQRVHDALAKQPVRQPERSAPTHSAEKFDLLVRQAPWWLQRFAANWLQSVREFMSQSISQQATTDDLLQTAQQGVELLHARAQRLMQQCDLERIDVAGLPFDAELMHAVDSIHAPGTPSTHVAEQIRPAYRWHGKLLRYADVRIAK